MHTRWPKMPDQKPLQEAAKNLGAVLGRIDAGLALDLQLAEAGELRTPSTYAVSH